MANIKESNKLEKHYTPTDGNWINKGTKNLSKLKTFIILNIRKEKLKKI